LSPGNIANGDVNVVVSEELRSSPVHGPVHCSKFSYNYIILNIISSVMHFGKLTLKRNSFGNLKITDEFINKMYLLD